MTPVSLSVGVAQAAAPPVVPPFPMLPPDVIELLELDDDEPEPVVDDALELETLDALLEDELPVVVDEAELALDELWLVPEDDVVPVALTPEPPVLDDELPLDPLH